MLLRMSALVEVAIRDSVRALVERDSDLALQVIKNDRIVNEMDVHVDEECIKLLALVQPMASDLRFITTAMKLAPDLERIADNAVNIAERAIELNEEPILKPYVDIPYMCNIASGMVRDAIDALINRDKRLAMDVIMRDDEIDDLNDSIFQEVTAIMTRNPETVHRAIKVIYISKYLERIADHATNLAEHVLFLMEGKILRHMDLGAKKFKEE
ncbi:MAG: phosphate signaling complex protein PhoU [Phycisphaerae bacterium]|nr:phosphate signaling complex protein PhoU [Phycisphaerae bacterium]NIW40678.1 phosphate signaling complex protein PhoU [candidate division Zixibacteria bacterium]NIP53170.1 phosphate signaling complex protein PhoU [Phycisphaerae bacterium]NIU09730.1 phosphate signaling complex protein PhoU [Phycisphaerae bacterium]NIW99511.1 phosphate signaling complex protein PhoU [Phycisphaerae bacterium]